MQSTKQWVDSAYILHFLKIAGYRFIPEKNNALHLAEQDSHSSHNHQFVAHEETSTLLFNTQSFIFHAQIALSKSWYQMANYYTFPLTGTVIHSLKCIQETSYMCVPKSYKNNNPRKQNKEITIAEFTAGAAAYQSNDRKSSPNKVQKSCRTNTTAIIVLKKQERDKSNTGACSQVSSYSSVLKFLAKTQLFSTCFRVSSPSVHTGADQIQTVFCLTMF